MKMQKHSFSTTKSSDPSALLHFLVSKVGKILPSMKTVKSWGSKCLGCKEEQVTILRKSLAFVNLFSLLYGKKTDLNSIWK